MTEKTIDVLMKERRAFPPDMAFSEKAHIKGILQGLTNFSLPQGFQRQGVERL